MVLQQVVAPKSNQSNQITPPVPPVGFSPFLRKHLHLELQEIAKKYGNVFQINAGGRTLIVLNGLDAIKEALCKQQDIFSARADFAVFKQPPQSQFLELKSGKPWEKHHSIVGQVIHNFAVSQSDTLEGWAIEEATNLGDLFLKFGNQPFDPDLYLPLGTLSFMQRLIFGRKGTGADIEEDPTFMATALTLKHIPKVLDAVKLEFIPKIWLPLFQFSRLKTLKNFIGGLTALESYVAKNVEEHKQSFDPENLLDVTDGLLQASNELTLTERQELGLGEKDIVNGSLMQFAGAGGGLPSIILRWALLYAIAYPDVQEQIQAELDQVVGKGQTAKMEHRNKLRFTRAFIAEVLRHSSITTMPPITYGTNSDAVVDGYFIPKNSPVLINYYSLTRDERHWKQPEKFDPNRFLDANGELKHQLTEKFYPFGVGARRCVGEYLGRWSIFLFMTNLLLRCQFEKAPREKLSLEPQPGVFVIPANYRVVVKPRL